MIKSRKKKDLIYKKPGKPTSKRPTLIMFAGAYVYRNKKLKLCCAVTITNRSNVGISHIKLYEESLYCLDTFPQSYNS